MPLPSVIHEFRVILGYTEQQAQEPSPPPSAADVQSYLHEGIAEAGHPVPTIRVTKARR